MRQLDCRDIQVDEIWSFVAMKPRTLDPDDNTACHGDVWTIVAVDPETKPAPSFLVRTRTWEDTNTFCMTCPRA